MWRTELTIQEEFQRGFFETFTGTICLFSRPTYPLKTWGPAAESCGLQARTGMVLQRHSAVACQRSDTDEWCDAKGYNLTLQGIRLVGSSGQNSDMQIVNIVKAGYLKGRQFLMYILRDLSVFFF